MRGLTYGLLTVLGVLLVVWVAVVTLALANLFGWQAGLERRLNQTQPVERLAPAQYSGGWPWPPSNH